jgi:hypothetical protein
VAYCVRSLITCTQSGHDQKPAALITMTMRDEWSAADPDAEIIVAGRDPSGPFIAAGTPGRSRDQDRRADHDISVSVHGRREGGPHRSRGARPYDGRAALQAASTVAPLGQWRTVSLRAGTRLRLPTGARDLFVYVSPHNAGLTLYDARLIVTQGRRTFVDKADELPHLPGFVPWNRLHVNLSTNTPIAGISISVRVKGTSDSGQDSFQVDDVAGPMSATAYVHTALPPIAFRRALSWRAAEPSVDRAGGTGTRRGAPPSHR